MTSTEARLALNLLPKIGPVRIQRLLAVFGSPEAILKARASQIEQVEGFGSELASTVANWENHADLSRELRRIKEEGLTLLTPEDDLYPKLLREIHDPPQILYVRGKLTSRDQHGIAIVGSRRTTQYGLSSSKKLAFQLAYAGYSVISGLARGIDTAAHEGALASKGRTIAVIGAGHAKLYPPENAALAERIASQGAVISEYPVDFPPDKTTFPQRNRIVSGWSMGTIVVEAALKSGALITATQAMEQGRTVFAVPGNIDRPSSHGCNRLIQQGAKLIQDGADVLEEFNLFSQLPLDLQSESKPAPDLPPDEAAVYAALGTEESHINDVISRSGLSVPVVTTTLMKLEMKKLVRPLPGKIYTRIV